MIKNLNLVLNKTIATEEYKIVKIESELIVLKKSLSVGFQTTTQIPNANNKLNLRNFSSVADANSH
jgi:hypothetical protein